jgi:hypothetical protein
VTETLRVLGGGLLGRLEEECPLVEVRPRLDLGREMWEIAGIRGGATVISVRWQSLSWACKMFRDRYKRLVIG